MPSNATPPRRRSWATTAVALGSVVVLAMPAVRADVLDDLEAAHHRQSRVLKKIGHEEHEIRRLRDAMNRLAARIEEAISRMNEAAEEARRARAQLDRVRARYEMLRTRLEERVAEEYMFGFPGEVVYLLDASSIEDMGDRLLYVGTVTAQEAEVAALVDEQQQRLAEVEAQLAEVLADRQEAVEALDENEDALRRLLRRQDVRLRRLGKLRGRIDKEVGALTEKVRAKLLALGGDGVYGPLYRCPVDGPVAYGDTFGIIHHHPGWTHKHMGNDMMAAMGTPVVAPFDGYVTQDAERNAGIYVKVVGDEGYVLMMHLMKVGKLGPVKEGAVVGWVGDTGNASAPHVHFEWHPGGGTAVDPYAQLNEVC